MKSKLLIPLTLLSLVACNQSPVGQLVEFDYVMSAEPIVSATNSNDKIFKSLQNDYRSVTNKKIYQASIFVNNNTDTDKINKFLADISSSINAALSTPGLIKTTIESAISNVEEQQFKFGVPGAMGTKVTNNNNGFNLGYEDALTNKEDILYFVNLLTNNSFTNISDDYFYQSATPSETADASSLTVLAPTGAPAFALYSLAASTTFTTSNPETGLMPEFNKGEYDIIVAPTQGGMTKIVKQSASYKIAATVTFGNFYLLSFNRDEDETLNKGDKVCVFQQNDLPGKLFNYLYGELELDITAVNAASDTKVVITNNGTIRL